MILFTDTSKTYATSPEEKQETIFVKGTSEAASGLNQRNIFVDRNINICIKMLQFKSKTIDIFVSRNIISSHRGKARNIF